jgi:hypothetical protein
MSDFIEQNTIDLDNLGFYNLESIFEDALNNVTGTPNDVHLLQMNEEQKNEPAEANEPMIELEPAPEPAVAAANAQAEVPMRRTTRQRVPRKNWGPSPAPIEQARRPGRKPVNLDADLSPEELKRKNRRRAQNKEAAARQRQKKLDKGRAMEEEILQLQQTIKQKDQLIEQLREQLAAANTSVHTIMNTNKPNEQELCQTQAYPDEPFQDGPMDYLNFQ